MTNPLERFRGKESTEIGRNVHLRLKFLRHGERDPDGRLTDYGREVTRQRAEESTADKGYPLVKAIGSDAGFSSGYGARAFETADIYAQGVAGKPHKPRVRKALNYETLKNPVPYDHKAIYNSHLPEDFASLSDEEKSKAAKHAQKRTLDHFFKMEGPEAENYRREAAGAFASVIRHYTEVARRLKSGTRALYPAGTHGGTMELLLQQALVRKRDGESVIGFKDIAEIGGEFDPSDAYNVDVETDADGGLKDFKVTFDKPERGAPGDEFMLDTQKVNELADYYESLHRDDPEEKS